jgi:hypothetical protein
MTYKIKTFLFRKLNQTAKPSQKITMDPDEHQQHQNEFQKLLRFNYQNREAPVAAHSKGHASKKRSVIHDFLHWLSLCGE